MSGCVYLALWALTLSLGSRCALLVLLAPTPQSLALLSVTCAELASTTLGMGLPLPQCACPVALAAFRQVWAPPCVPSVALAATLLSLALLPSVMHVPLASTTLASELLLVLCVFPVELAAMQQGWGPPCALCAMLGTTPLDWVCSPRTRAAQWIFLILRWGVVYGGVQQEQSVVSTM